MPHRSLDIWLLREHQLDPELVPAGVLLDARPGDPSPSDVGPWATRATHDADLVSCDDERTGMAGRHRSGLPPSEFERHTVGAEFGQGAIEEPFVDLGWVDRRNDSGVGEQRGAVARGRREHQWQHRSSLAHLRGGAHRYDDPVAAALPYPNGCAVVTMELQRGVVGDLAPMPALVDAAAQRGTLGACGAMVRGARAHEVPVVHARVRWAADRRGTPLVTPLISALARRPDQMLEGTAAVDLIDELGEVGTDLSSWRRHGLTPFTGTDLDQLLRSLGAHTVIAIGVSLNVGVLGLCLSATDLGYRVVVPTDAVVGVPADYGDTMLANSIATMATLTTVDELLGHWAG